jgi:putative transposase
VRTDVLSSQHTAYEATRKVYGSPRVHAEVQAQGIRCSRKRVACLMRTMGLCARRPRRWTRTTKQDPTAKVSLNLLARDLTARRPNQKWAGDSTAIWTAEGWLYLAARLDLFSRRVGGWAMAATQDESLVESALRMAVLTRHPQAGLLHHSDRGCQYTSHRYQALLADLRITVSMSRTGNCWDNAVTEAFFGTLKGECVALSSFRSRSEARSAVFEYVVAFYNRVRRHSSLGYVSPAAFEQLYQ